jgi:hypothetical protein
MFNQRKQLPMKNNLYLTLALFFLSAALAHSQVQLPYSTGFDNAVEQDGWNTYRLGAIGQFNNWGYNSMNPHGAPLSIYHNYPVGGTSFTDDWFVSPMMNLESGGMIESVWHAFAGFGLPQTTDTVAIYLLIGSPNPGLATERILLHDYRADYQNDNTWYETEDIPIPAAASISYIAFRYKTVVNWLDVKFDDISISATVTGVDEHLQSAIDVQVYPNPASELIRLKSYCLGMGEQVDISIYNSSGIKVKEVSRVPMTDVQIDTSTLPSGAYLVEIVHNGGRITKHFIK